MPTLQKIFVVIDPTTDVQTALSNAAWIATQDSSISIHVFEAIYSARDNTDAEALQRVELARHKCWVDTLVEPIRKAGNEVTIEIE
ncbi:MAG: hypothetical protein QGG02_04070 [Gammaproteobacteria bacterium]|jgi:hypothetical protein|nr:hypothetical protein [Gammaproteobacteria bacterium]MDP6733166.1 hypothetical protein [Gammaproteobacteria bacterium]|tara:strand:- start:897 stop:1154 length:258 start_codon:yes stop_codon:yes gene_type:complete